jgi:glycosyltransferase involved in cell wall biosynthesis
LTKENLQQPAVLFVAAPGWTPAATGIGGGTAIISHSLLNVFAEKGARVGFCALIKPKQFPGINEANAAARLSGVPDNISLFLGPRMLNDADGQIVADAVNRFQPDIIYCYGPEAALHASLTGSTALRIVTFYDPPHTISLHRMGCDLRYGTMREKVGALRKWRSLLGRWRSYRGSHLRGLATADVIIAHAYNHGQQHARTLGRSVGYFPNPVLPVTPVSRGDLTKPPTFLLVGSVTSTVSRTGLQYFVHEVLRHLRPALERGDLQIKIIGGGDLREAYFETLKATTGIHIAGFIDQDALISEYAKCAAILVPTPIPVGFRTRIIDGFRYGVPVITHTANRAGFVELEDGRNCLMADDGRMFAHRILDTVADQSIAERVAARALLEFSQEYSAQVYYDFIYDYWKGGKAPPNISVGN